MRNKVYATLNALAEYEKFKSDAETPPRLLDMKYKQIWKHGAVVIMSLNGTLSVL